MTDNYTSWIFSVFICDGPLKATVVIPSSDTYKLSYLF